MLFSSGFDMTDANNAFHHRRASMLQRRPSPVVPPVNGDMYDSIATPTRSTPVPYYRILPLLIARLAEGMTYTIIFPYINDMIHSFGVQEQDVGYYAGLVVRISYLQRPSDGAGIVIDGR